MNWAQLQAILWLRWRLTRNQWARGSALGPVMLVVVTVIAVCLGLGAGVAGVAVGWFGLREMPPEVLLLVWDVLVVVFLFMWTTGVAAELQRADMMDLGRLLHLPVSLPQIFLLNYVASHLSMSLVMMGPAMVGLAVGLSLGGRPAMVLLLPLIVGFFFMITAWTYCLRRWLAGLMANPRRRRAIVVGITLCMVLLAQTPNLVNMFWLRSHGSNAGGLFAAANLPALLRVAAPVHALVPLLWVPNGAWTLAQGHVWQALLDLVGVYGLGALGLYRAYRSTLRHHGGGQVAMARGAAGASAGADLGAVRAPAAVRAPKPAPTGELFVAWRLPWVPESAAALGLATCQSMARAPEVKLALTMNVVIFAAMGVGLLLSRQSALPAAVLPVVVSSSVLATFFGLSQLMFNFFGFDRSGFRALMLLPTPRREVLLGKNLAMLPWAAGIGLGFLLLLTAVLRPSPWAVAAAVLQFAAAFAALSALGNLAAILVPYRVNAGTLRPTRMKPLTTLLLMVMHMGMVVVVAPVMGPPLLGMLCAATHVLPAGPVNLGFSLVLAAIGGLIYWLTLNPLAALLTRREQAILTVLTQEVE